MSAKEELFKEAALPNPAAQEWARSGKKVFGTVCCYVPEELLHAAGVLPVRVRATGAGDDSLGKAWMSTYSCSYARTSLQRLIDGTYDYLDGIVASDGCLMAERIYDNWRYSGKEGGKFKHLIQVPRVHRGESGNWMREELVLLKEALENYLDVEITDEKLRASVKLYNETRALIRELYGLQKDGRFFVKGSDVMRVVLAAMSMPKERFNELLREYLDEVKAAGPVDSDNVRVMFVGSAMDDPGYIEAIEECGADVVADVQCFGSRYLWEPVDEEKEPLDALADLYMNRPTCPRMMDKHDALYETIDQFIDEYQVEGVIQTTMRNCDLWNGEQLIFGKRYKRDDIPVLMLEREEVASGEGQLGVRVGAFVEMLEGEED